MYIFKGAEAMNKHEFLDDLARYLLILEDEEQSDILEEYEQHIDMKVESGLSEDEAIQDFGSVKQLAAEILEAYHVKAEFSGNNENDKKYKENVELSQIVVTFHERIIRLFKKTTHSIKKAGMSCWNIGKRIGRCVISGISIPVVKIHAAFSKKKEDGESLKSFPTRRARMMGTALETESEVTYYSFSSYRRPLFRPAAHAATMTIKGFISWLVRLFFWCVRWCFNFAMVFIAFFGGILTLAGLFCFAVLIVWLFQGYPLVGTTIASLGFLLCSGAFTVFCASLVLTKQKKNVEHVTDIMTMEVHDA